MIVVKRCPWVPCYKKKSSKLFFSIFRQTDNTFRMAIEYVTKVDYVIFNIENVICITNSSVKVFKKSLYQPGIQID